MANTNTNILRTILARGLLALRSKLRMPMLVNSDYSTEARQFGDTVDIPVSASVGTQAIAPSNTPPAPGDTTIGKVSIALDQWFGSDPFHLSDKDIKDINSRRDFVPLQLSEAAEAVASLINTNIASNYTGIYGFTGTAGTTPFASDVTDATNARKILAQQKADDDPRWGVVDFDAEANMLALAPFSDAEKIMSDEVKIRGEIGMKYGIGWAAGHGIPTHTAGAGTGYLVNDLGATLVVGDTTIPVDTGTGAFVVGDIISFSGHTQTYVINTAYGGGAGNLDIRPGLVAVPADNEAITERASHVVNLAFHRDCFGYATRALVDTDTFASDGNMVTLPDPVTGLVFRLEVTRQYKQTAFQIDALWGSGLVRPEFGVRIAG